MNLVVLGEDMYTTAVVESVIKAGHRVLLMICPDNPRANFKVLEETASKNEIAFIKNENINSAEIREKIREIKPDLIITAHLRKILSKEIFSLSKKGAINIHPSLLPKYRGLSPQHQALIHGDTESGVTVHYIDEGVDTGEIIVQKKFPVSKADYIINVQARMIGIYRSIIVEALNLLESDSFTPVKQDLSQVSYFGPLKKSDREIDLSKTAEEIYNLIRAVSLPYKGAYYKNYIIWAAEIRETTAELKSRYDIPGFYVDENGNKVIISVRDGFLESEDFEIN